MLDLSLSSTLSSVTRLTAASARLAVLLCLVACDSKDGATSGNSTDDTATATDSTTDATSTGGSDPTEANPTTTTGETTSTSTGSSTGDAPEDCDPNDPEACSDSEAAICHPDHEVCVECLDWKDCCPGLEDPMCVYTCSADGRCVDAV